MLIQDKGEFWFQFCNSVFNEVFWLDFLSFSVDFDLSQTLQHISREELFYAWEINTSINFR